MKYTCAIVKTPKYAVSTSGDSAEVVERPLGGLSALVVDGQGSGRGAKTLSTSLVGKAANLINDGIRDGAVARAVHDLLFARKHGRVSATISIISLASDTNTLVITRCGNCPVFTFAPSGARRYDEPSDPIGFYRFTRPQVDQVELAPGLMAVTFSDGVLNAGRSRDRALDVAAWEAKIAQFCQEGNNPSAMAENILKTALALDESRANDDMTVLIMGILDAEANGIRRLQVEYPVG